MKIDIERSGDGNRKRYAIDPNDPQQYSLTLDDARYWGLLQITSRTGKAVAETVRDGIDHEIRKWNIDLGTPPQPTTWRTRLAYWLMRTGRK